MSVYTPGRPPYNTPNYGFPVPGGTGFSDYITATEALANAVDTAMRNLENVLDPISAIQATFVANLPTTGLVDGQEVYYQTAVMAGNGTVWHLRYRAAAPAATRWEFLGGGPIEQTVPGGAGGGSYVGPLASGLNPVPAGPTFTVPRPGDYIFNFGAVVQSATVGTINIGIDGGGIPSNAAPMIQFSIDTAAVGYRTGSLSVRRNVATANSTLAMFAIATASDVMVGSRYLSITPIRLG
jgi:hypothetical protein